jgi:hypothetical protein
MSQYKIFVKEVPSFVSRDVQKAASELAEVNTALSAGWKPQGGVASIQAGTNVCLIQAMVKDAR